MNDLKFRAWDKDTKKMYYPGDKIKVSSEGLEIFYEGGRLLGTDRDYWELRPNAEVTLHTGFKDCNGKAIYIGDIIKQHHNSHLSREGEYKHGYKNRITDTEREAINGFGIYEVVFGDCSIKIRGKSGHINGYFTNFTYIDKDKPEVIGNIYENPELLK